MGFCMSQRSCCNFFMKKENFEKALEAVKKLHGQETIGDHFSWVDKEFYNAKTFPEIMNAWRWEVFLDTDGNAVELYFEGEKLGDDELLFQTIAPFVDQGEIEMEGDEHSHWKWVFKDKKLVELTGMVVYGRG